MNDVTVKYETMTKSRIALQRAWVLVQDLHDTTTDPGKKVVCVEVGKDIMRALGMREPLTGAPSQRETTADTSAPSREQG